MAESPTAPSASYVTLDRGHTLILDKGHGPLGVASGQVELYVIGHGRRMFLGLLGPGALLAAGEQCTGRLMVLALQPVRLLPLADPLPIQPEELAAALNRWVESVSSGLGKLALARPALETLTPGQTLHTDDDVAITSAHGPLWIQPQGQGDVQWMGMMPVALHHPVPVHPQSWLTMTPGISVTAHTTLEMIRRPDWFTVLLAFNDAVVAVTDRLAEATEQAESQRIDQREAQTERDISAGMDRLQRLLADHTVVLEEDTDFAHAYHLITGNKPDPQALKIAFASFEQFVSYHHGRLRTIQLRDRWWIRDLGPLVATRRQDNRLAVLRKDGLGRYRLHVRGEKSRRVDAGVAEELHAEVQILTLPLPNTPLGVMDILAIGLALCRLDLGLLITTSLAAALLGLLLPVAMGILIDTYIPAGMRGPTVLIGGALMVTQLCMSALNVVSGMLRQRMDGRMAERIGGGIMDRMMRLPTSLTRTMASADLALRIASVDIVRRALMGMALNALMSGITGMTGIFLLIYYSPLAGAAAFALVLLLVVGGVIAGKRQMKAFYQGEAMTVNVITFTQQIIENIPVLRAFAAERRAFARWATDSAEMRARSMQSKRIAHGFEAFLAAYQTLAIALVFAILGLGFGPENGVSTGGYMVFVTTFQGFLRAGVVLVQGINQVLNLKPQLDRALPLLKNTPETPPHAKDPGILSGALEVSNLSFRHGENRPILTAVSFRCAPGAYVALVGPSGSGKSTLLSLLVGFEKPAGGNILYDGRDLSGLDVAAVRRQIGYVRQNGRLFAGSLLDNIKGPHKAELKDIWKAAELSGIAEDIRQWPMGLHTVVTEGSTAFSQGQIQRILLARALIGKPRLLFLDEATSALDNVSQMAVANNIDTMGITRIVIAHRLSTIRNAGLILFLDGGRIVESGTYDQLVQQGGTFAQFVRLQAL